MKLRDSDYVSCPKCGGMWHSVLDVCPKGIAGKQTSSSSSQLELSYSDLAQLVMNAYSHEGYDITAVEAYKIVDKTIDEIASPTLLQTLTELKEGLPVKKEKVKDYDGEKDEGGRPFCATCGLYIDGDEMPENCYCDHYNDAIDEVATQLETKIKQLERGE